MGPRYNAKQPQLIVYMTGYLDLFNQYGST